MRFLRGPGIGLCIGVFVAAAAFGQAPGANLTGEWELTTLFFGVPLAERLTLKVEKGKLTGSVRHRGKSMPVSGRFDGEAVSFEYKGDDGSRNLYEGRIQGAELAGRYTATGGESWGETPPAEWRARRAAAASDKPAAPRTLDFEPTEFSRVFSATVPPVMRIWPGDTVRTRTVDAGGRRREGQGARARRQSPDRPLLRRGRDARRRARGARPEAAAQPRHRHLRRRPRRSRGERRLRRRSQGRRLQGRRLEARRRTRDRHPRQPDAAVEGAVRAGAPDARVHGRGAGFGSAPVRTGDSGPFGGNMDFSGIREGATVYLPVAQPGALLYVGDGHALQGDGELNGNALETSLDVEITVELLREKKLQGPRVENAESLMTIGLAGSLDDAFAEATSDLASWLQEDYQLTGSETAILLGAAIEYQIAEVADRNAGVVARIKKSLIPPAPATPPAAGKKP